jgi:general secretion pathway protein F
MNEERLSPASSRLARARPLSLDDLIALNDEIAALVRSGVPLEEGLAELGLDLPSRLGRFTRLMAERIASGESLSQAMAAEADQVPAAYRAVVEAGIRAGRLPAALESTAAAARRMAELRQFALLAATYPLLVILLAWCGLLFFACVLAPQLAEMFHAFDVPGYRSLESAARAGHVAWIWGPIVPLALLLLGMAFWLTAKRPSMSGGSWFEGAWSGSRLGWMPWVGTMQRSSCTATFLEILALLVENQTPLPESLILAAEASGDRQTLRSARCLADAMQSGQTQPIPGEPTFPPLVNWLLSSVGRDDALLPALRHAAAAHHRRARHQAEMFRLLLPIVLTIALGGTVVASYALMLFLPYISLLHGLGG